MKSPRSRIALDAPLMPARLARAHVSGADPARWQPVAAQMSVREAIACVLAQAPKQPVVEVLELIDNRKAKQANRANAAYAVLAALLDEEPAHG